MTSTSARVTPWESQGCEICRRQWETSERPPRVAENAADHSALHQCAVCRTYWLLTERAAVAVERATVRSTYPIVDERMPRAVEDETPEIDADVLSDALTAYLGWPGAPHPLSDVSAVADVATGVGVDQAPLLRAVREALTASESLPLESTERPAAAAAKHRRAVRDLLPHVRADAIDALTSRSFWIALREGDSAGNAPRRAPTTDTPPAPAPSTPTPRDDAVQYWRHSVGHSVRYFALVGRRDLLLDQDTWVPYHHYKSGPSWWRLTGDTDADIIDASELPPGSPRPPIA